MTYTLDELNDMVAESNEKGGDLWLNELTSIPEGFSPKICGCLSLDGLTSIPEGFNPVVGKSLYLDGLTSIPDGFAPAVGGSLFLDGLTSAEKKRARLLCKKLRGGDYVPGKYLYADGIITHVRRKKKIGDYTYFVGKIPGKNVIFDGKNYAHCQSFSDGVCELTFKAAKDRGAKQYRGMTLDSVVTPDEARVMYRIITGACQQGTQHFIDGLAEIKDHYTVREIINLTAGQYGSEQFKRFFEEDEND